MFREEINSVFDEAVAEDYTECDKFKLACLDWMYGLADGDVLDVCGRDDSPFYTTGGRVDMHEELHGMTECYDTIFVRHVLEHSIMPFIMLKELHRLLNLNGKLIIVVPENNRFICEFKNHYSCFDRVMWESLFRKAGFSFRFLGSAFFGAQHEKVEWRYELRRLV